MNKDEGLDGTSLTSYQVPTDAYNVGEYGERLKPKSHCKRKSGKRPHGRDHAGCRASSASLRH